jgi:molybdopterin-guanine dinucleotide biosynthesis protein A
MQTLEGAVLIGGQSRRMGRNKATLRIGVRTVLERVVLALRPLVQNLCLIGASSAPLPETLSHMAVEPDRIPGLGPLSGIHTALLGAESPVVVVACDLPFVTTDFLSGLAERLEPNFDAVVPEASRGPVAVCAVYRPRCLPELEARISSRALSAGAFARALRTRWVRTDELSQMDPSGRCLTNLNTPEDYEAALALVEAEGSLSNESNR